MAREMVRERKVTDPAPDPSIDGLADQRTYLYLALDQKPGDGDVGLAVDVVLKGGSTIFTSDHYDLGTFFAVHRRGPAATTVKLPPGTTPADIASISVRCVTPLFPGGTVSGASVDVTATRPGVLPRSGRPAPRILRARAGQRDRDLAAPTQVIWLPAT